MIERLGSFLAERKGLAIAVLALAAPLIRLSLLPALPAPVPEVHDEFSYLLAADTFAHGRLTNPTHPMWIFFETFHVLEHPTYMSKFPPAQGMALALGQLLGNPWIGVLLATSAMCAACLWMLQGWFPARWALLGATLVTLRLGISSYWINSYWGGAVAAIGGALVMGALPRLLRSPSPRNALMLGLGAGILANSRPLEGTILCIPVLGVLLITLIKNHGVSRKVLLMRAILPLCMSGVFCAIFIGYYNWRVTRNPLLFPYSLHESTYSSLPLFQWQTPGAPLRYSNPQFKTFYNDSQAGWGRLSWSQGKIDGPVSLLAAAGRDLKSFVSFFLWPELCVPFVVLPWVVRDRRVRFLLIQLAMCLGGFLLVVWFQPHYAAPVVATTFAVVTQGVRHLRTWHLRGRPVGVALSRVVVLSALALAPLHGLDIGVHPSLLNRAALANRLDALEGKHLVIVRYSSEHDPNDEWVYNRADIDHAKIVWARDIPNLSLAPLLDYFYDRRVWLVEPDSDPQLLSPYTQSPTE